MMSKRSTTWLLMGVLVLSALILSACAPAPTPEPPTPAPTMPLPPEPTAEPTAPPADQSAFMVAWESGPHNAAYDLGKGPNDYCSRCHSPQNWNPESLPDAAPNCVTCKFATDAELRIAKTMNFVDEPDWVGIPCATCHEVFANGEVSSDIAWLNPLTMTYDTINTPNELCRKCHINSGGVKFSGGRGASHEIVLGGSAHENYAGEFPQADRPQYCSDCHDPHSGQPKACQDCHTDIAASETHMKGFNAFMIEKVDCMACHDSSGLDVGPHPDDAMGGVFTTIVTSTSRSGAVSTSYTHSHSIQWLVACDRCHFEGNEWELSVRDADGELVEVEAPTATP